MILPIARWLAPKWWVRTRRHGRGLPREGMNWWLISIYRLRRQPIVGGKIWRNERGLTSRIRIRRSADLTNRHMTRRRSTRSCRRTHSCPKWCSSTTSGRSVVLGFMQMPHFECVAQLRYSNCWRVEEIVCFRSNSNGPSLNSRVFIGKETQIEMPGPLPVKGEPIHAFRRICSHVVLQEEVQIIFWPMFVFFVGH